MAESSTALRNCVDLALQTQSHEFAGRFLNLLNEGRRQRDLVTASMALVRQYCEATNRHHPPILALAKGSGLWQGDPLLTRNAASSLEEYEAHRSPFHDELLLSWEKYVAGCVKRSVEFDCYELFNAHFKSVNH